MSFKQIYKNDAPVFDKPAKSTAKGFFIRRLMSLAGKPVMAEKNLPIQPATSELSGKCFINEASRLYRQQGLADESIRFKPAVRKLAIPQSNFSAKLDGISDNSWPIRLKNPVLNAINSDKITSSPAKTPDIAKPLLDTRYFASRAVSASSYAFSAPASAPEFLGIRANLRSIKFTQIQPENVVKPSLFAGIDQKCTWQPPDLNYQYQQILYSSRFSANDNGFFVYPPDCFSPVLYPGEYGFLPVTQDFFCALRQATCKPVIVTKPWQAEKTHTATDFDSRQEFARNLVIECKTLLRPICGNKEAIHSRKRMLNPSWASNNRHLRPEEVRIHKSSYNFNSCTPRLKCENKIQTGQRRDLPAALSRMVVAIDALKTDFSSRFLLNIASSPARSRINLRLRLKRANYADIPPTLQPIIEKCRLKSAITLPARIYADYIPFVRAEQPASFAQQSLAAPASPSVYATKRSSMRFMVARHANYCRKALKTISLCYSTRPLRSKPSSHHLPHTMLLATKQRKENFAAAKPACTALKVIYLRPMPFLMKLGAPEFTNISLPATQRRAQPSATRFYSELSLLPWRRKSVLRSLRFKLSRIAESPETIRFRAQRRINLPLQAFSLYEKEEQIEQIKPVQIFAATSSKTYIPGYRGRLERFSVASVAPVAIVAELKLKMPIMGSEITGNLAQRHFINPAAWEKSVKIYNCRIRLAPHPFGFPEFMLPVSGFRPVESAVAFEYLTWANNQIGAGSNYSMPREKAYLPPLSLKNPRRFLFPENIFASLPRDFYQTRNFGLAGKFSVPTRVSSFDHEWGMQKNKKLASKISARPFSSRARQKLTDNFATDFSDEKYSPTLPAIASLSFHMPRVKRLLLSIGQFFGTAVNFTELPGGQGKSVGRPTSFTCTIRLPNEEVFRKPGLTFLVNKAHHQEFAPKFSSAALESGSIFDFRHRPRIFRFPYRPDHEKPECNVDYATQEEPLLDRLTFFDQLGGSNCYLTLAGVSNPLCHAFRSQMTTRKESQSRGYSFSTIITENALFCEPERNLETRLDYEKSKFAQHIDKAAFLRLLDFSRLRLKKFIRVRSQITGYLTGQMHSSRPEFISAEGFQPPARFSFDSLHWVILLRNFIELATQPPTYLSSRARTAFLHPRFLSVPAGSAAVYREKQQPVMPASLQPAPRIYNFTLPPATSTEKIAPDCAHRFFSQPSVMTAVFSQTAFAPCRYECSERADKFKVIVSIRPEYRRSLQLYILHLALNTEDYGLHLEISDRSSVGAISSRAKQTSPYKHPDLPEWLDLAQTLVPRTKLKI